MLPDRPMTREEVLEAVDRAAHDVFLEEWDRLEREELALAHGDGKLMKSG